MVKLNERGQEFSVFKLLISAVVAIVILTLLLSILGIIPLLPSGSLTAESESLLTKIERSPAAEETSNPFTINPNDSLNRRQLADKSQGLGVEQICLHPGNFKDDSDWTESQLGTVLRYDGSSGKKVMLAGMCYKGKELADAVKDGVLLESDWVEDCESECTDSTQTCCIIAVVYAS